MGDNVKKQHISSAERERWDSHIGSSGVESHKLGDGTIPGFSTNDFSNTDKTQLITIVKNLSDIRFTINDTPPENPVVNKEFWIDTNTNKAQIYKVTGWEPVGGGWI